ncbi:PIN domain-containing protein [Herbiconiux sp. 11R-BC]|uniref:PIN domain-containing protein n=1 Tax=Herbiconiux sp. 11R-BC TaxID=3111637 RepID=UPI003BFE140B
MIILDTNVISELTHRDADRRVIDWIDAQPAPDIHTTSISVAELVFGVVRKPAGSRRTELSERLSRCFDDMIGDRILSFDADAAVE